MLPKYTDPTIQYKILNGTYMCLFWYVHVNFVDSSTINGQLCTISVDYLCRLISAWSLHVTQFSTHTIIRAYIHAHTNDSQHFHKVPQIMHNLCK